MSNILQGPISKFQSAGKSDKSVETLLHDIAGLHKYFCNREKVMEKILILKGFYCIFIGTEEPTNNYLKS